MRRVGRGRWAVVVLVLVAGLARAESSMVELLPRLKTMGPPAWFQRGVRLTWFVASASVTGSYEHYEPNEQGDYVDPRTGQHFDKVPSVGGGSGMGLVQLDVVGQEQGRALLSLRQFLLSTPAGGTQPVALPRTVSLCVGPAACPDDWWVNPAALAELQPGDHGALRVVPMPYEADGIKCRAVAVHYRAAKANRCSIYDLETGLLVSSYGSAEGKNDQTLLTMGRFRGMRRVDTAWAAGALPAWVHTFHQLPGEGTYTVTTAGFTMPLRTTVTNQVRGSGADWVTLDQVATVMPAQPGMPPMVTNATLVSTPGVVGSLFLPPAALAGVTAQQALDRDALVGTTLVVVGARGGLVQLRENGPAHTHDFLYDATSGQLRRARFEDRSVAHSVIDVQFDTPR